MNFEMPGIGGSFKTRGQRSEIRDRKKARSQYLRAEGIRGGEIIEKKYSVEKAKGSAERYKKY